MSKHPIHQFTNIALALCAESGAHRRGLAGGIADVTARRALPYVYQHLQDPRHHKVGIRMAGLIGFHPNVVHSTEQSFGASMRQLTIEMTDGLPDLDSPDRVANSLSAIQNQRMDQAAMTISRLVSLAGARGVPVNFHSIASMLAYWGNGITAASRDQRRRALRDYYTHTPVKKVAA